MDTGRIQDKKSQGKARVRQAKPTSQAKPSQAKPRQAKPRKAQTNQPGFPVLLTSHLDCEAVEAGFLLLRRLGVFGQDPLPDGRQRYPVFLVEEAHGLRVGQGNSMIRRICTHIFLSLIHI